MFIVIQTIKKIVMQEKPLELFAIINLFGHSKLAGKVTEQQVAGCSFVRIDIPETTNQPAFTRFVNPTAVYDINPVTEEVMLHVAQSIQSKPIESWDIKKLNEKLLSLGVANKQHNETNDNHNHDNDDLPY